MKSTYDWLYNRGIYRSLSLLFMGASIYSLAYRDPTHKTAILVGITVLCVFASIKVPARANRNH